MPKQGTCFIYVQTMHIEEMHMAGFKLNDLKFLGAEKKSGQAFNRAWLKLLW